MFHPLLNTLLPNKRSPPNHLNWQVVTEEANQESNYNNGDHFSLQDWLDPVVPGPCQTPSNMDIGGFNILDDLGVWDCALSRFTTVSNIPQPLQPKWASLYDRVLQRIERAISGGDQESLTRALKAWLILPQLILRQGPRGGR